MENREKVRKGEEEERERERKPMRLFGRHVVVTFVVPPFLAVFAPRYYFSRRRYRRKDGGFQASSCAMRVIDHPINELLIKARFCVFKKSNGTTDPSISEQHYFEVAIFVSSL